MIVRRRTRFSDSIRKINRDRETRNTGFVADCVLSHALKRIGIVALEKEMIRNDNNNVKNIFLLRFVELR